MITIIEKRKLLVKFNIKSVENKYMFKIFSYLKIFFKTTLLYGKRKKTELRKHQPLTEALICSLYWYLYSEVLSKTLF